MVQTKLCVVTHTFLPHVGGIERVVYEQSKRLLQKRFELKVLTNRIATAKQYNYDGISVRCYDSLSIGFRLGIPYPVLNLTSYKPFLELVKSSDLIHAHGHPYLSSFVAAKLAKKYSKPFVLTQHNTFIEYGSFWDTVERLNDLVVGKAVLKQADKIIVVSKDLVLHDSMEHILDSEKYTLKPVAPNQKSIAGVRNLDPDIFVIDGTDSGENVLSVCQTIRTFSGNPILVLAANSKPELVEKVLDAGADEFLLKPVSGKILAAYLNNLTRRARAENDAALILTSGNDGQNQSSRLLTY